MVEYVVQLGMEYKQHHQLQYLGQLDLQQFVLILILLDLDF
jgi:hypothetical protein